MVRMALARTPARHRLLLAVALLAFAGVAVAGGVVVASAPAADPVSAYPSPGTPVASTATSIALRGVAPADVGRVSVSGSRSGAHPGRLVVHSDGDGASFVPTRPFVSGERVTVRTGLDVAGARGGAFGFRVVAPVAQRAAYFGEVATRSGDAMTFRTRPDLAPPRLRIDRAASGAVAPGDLFYAPKVGPGQDGPTIADDAGQPVWLRPLPFPQQATDFRAQSYRGKRGSRCSSGTASATCRSPTPTPATR